MHVKLCWVVFVDSSFVAACSEKRKNARTPKLCRGGVKLCRPHAATRHCQSNFGRQRSCSQQNLGARSQSLLTKVTARLPLRPRWCHADSEAYSAAGAADIVLLTRQWLWRLRRPTRKSDVAIVSVTEEFIRLLTAVTPEALFGGKWRLLILICFC